MTYNKETCLLDMLFTQLEFQREMLNKRNIVSPDNTVVDTQVKLNLACYHSECTNIELAEFVDQLIQDSQIKTEDVLLELTDAFTFLLNQFLYANVLPTKTLEYYYSKAVKNVEALSHDGNDVSFMEIIGQYTVATGRFYHKTRYKSWKTYVEQSDNVFELIPLVDNMIICFLSLYVKLDVSCEDIFTYFYKKHETNVKRQEVGGKYEAA